MAELVDDLERLGMVERRADPSDGRAKLICLTEGGWKAMRTGHAVIAQLEADYERVIGAERFETMCQAIHALLVAQADGARGPESP